MSRRLSDTSQTMRALMQLREMLLNGVFKAGERLSELPLGERLQVSRSPLRLALAKLEHEGLVQLQITGGYVVRAFTQKDVADAIELRGVLEGTAARLAAERSPKDDALLQRMRDCCDAMDAALSEHMPGASELEDGDHAVLRYLELNERFHAMLVELCSSPVLARTIDTAMRLPFASPSAVVLRQVAPKAEGLRIAQSQHRALLSAIERCEGARAESIAREHARTVGHNVQHLLANSPGRAPIASLVRMGEATKSR